jgi:hypothetical protein
MAGSPLPYETGQPARRLGVAWGSIVWECSGSRTAWGGEWDCYRVGSFDESRLEGEGGGLLWGTCSWIGHAFLVLNRHCLYSA